MAKSEAEVAIDEDDPIREILEQQVKEHQAEFDALADADDEEGGDETDSEEGSDSTETSRGGKSKSSVETRKQTPDDTGSKGGGKRPGIDEVLREVESKLGTNQAEVVRSVLRDRSRLSSERAEILAMKQELSSAIEEIERFQRNVPDARQTTEETDPMLANLSPQQWELFEKMAKKAGFVQRRELDEEALTNASVEFVQKDVDGGIERWGEEFGSRDEDGRFHFNPDIEEEIEATHGRIFDPKRGVTARDLFILARHDKLVEEAAKKAQGDRGRRDAILQKRGQATRAITERAPAGAARPRVTVRQPNDSLEKVIARAYSASLREVPE